MELQKTEHNGYFRAMLISFSSNEKRIKANLARNLINPIFYTLILFFYKGIFEEISAKKRSLKQHLKMELVKNRCVRGVIGLHFFGNHFKISLHIFFPSPIQFDVTSH